MHRRIPIPISEPHVSFRRPLVAGGLATLLAAVPAAAAGSDGSLQDTDLDRRVRALEASLRQREDERDLQRVRIEALQERPAAMDREGPVQLRLLDASLNLLTTVGTSTIGDDEIPLLQPGHHDPNRRGFTLQNLELSLQGAVDPYFRGDAHIVWNLDREGETEMEIEEAYLTSLSLPYNLQFRFGHYFTEFGRHNVQHPHVWHFVDMPLVNHRMFGADGMRSPGARVSWLAPTPFYLELNTGVQHPRGEAMVSFLSNDDVGVFGGDREPFDREVSSLTDMVYTERIVASFDPTPEVAVAVGASALFGPNDTGPRGKTRIWGLDLHGRWRPLATDQGWPFVEVTIEQMWRRYFADAFEDSGGNPTVARTYRDSGIYGQVLYGFARPWVVGFRAEHVNGDGALTGDTFEDRHVRFSPKVSWYFSEFSRVRLQANFAKSQQTEDDDWETSVWLQFEINIGPHGAHRF